MEILDTIRLKTFNAKGSNDFPYQGIELFTGGQGVGKTLNLIMRLREVHKEYPDAIIVSNIPLFGIPYNLYRGIEDFDKYDNGTKGIIFVLDEIHTLYSSLKSKDMRDAELMVWCQNRKNRRLILSTAQRFSRVAKPIREQCYKHIEVLKPIFILSRYRVYDGYLYDDDGNYTGVKPTIEFKLYTASAMMSYDTHYVVREEKDENE